MMVQIRRSLSPWVCPPLFTTNGVVMAIVFPQSEMVVTPMVSSPVASAVTVCAVTNVVVPATVTLFDCTENEVGAVTTNE